MPESPPGTQTSLRLTPGDQSDQWLFDEITLGLAHLARFRLPRTPPTQVELDDCALGWVEQLRMWRSRGKPPSQTQIREAFLFLGDTMRDRWPTPGDFLAALDRRQAPHLDGPPELPASHPSRQTDHYAGDRLELTPYAAEIREVLARLPNSKLRLKFMAEMLWAPHQVHAPWRGPNAITGRLVLANWQKNLA